MTGHPIPDDALDSDIAILGRKGGGKTFTAKGIVERLLDMGRRVLVLDPLGVWAGLRTAADGEHAGYPVAIFGGLHADLPLDLRRHGSGGEDVMEYPDKLIADVNEAAAALATLPDGHRLARAVVDMRDLHERLNLALEATCTLIQATAGDTTWIADFLNRRTEVERALRAPMKAWRKGFPQPALTPDQLWELANRLSISSEFGRPRPGQT
ncbi:MAG: DUF87 domain-containing protein [Devosia sp.]|nr:DUF87 domain-containing protein [Devosia sp.]